MIHDLAWHEWLIDTNRLLKSKSIDAAIRNHYGPEVKGQLKTWAADIAEGEKGPADAVDAMLGYVRQSVSVAGLGFNVVSATMQPLGITQSIVRVGPQWVGRGIASTSRTRSAPRASQSDVELHGEPARTARANSTSCATRCRIRARWKDGSGVTPTS